ncbi:hypothetical protein [Pseudomonas typographi]|uniref:Uncharacterized protein n=1 Tax=Pseudomonas typographi TaxID=2715964 RepID=A0ABR7Z782_9PSED|nr:hypothetical protein [Pseudomonas typographi]MBD1601161.1 hypothetical protein [Pseudomonas typographi]
MTDQKDKKPTLRKLTCLPYSLAEVDGLIAISQPGANGEEDDVIFISLDQVDVFEAHLSIFAGEMRAAAQGVQS